MKIWFPAKRYGWGWGTPNCWQGWVVLAVYVVLVAAGAALYVENTGVFLLYVAALTALLLLVCWRKGERPRWRWGDKE